MKNKSFVKFECGKFVMDCHGKRHGIAIGTVKKKDGKRYYVMLDKNNVEHTSCICCDDKRFILLMLCEYIVFKAYMMDRGIRAMQRKYFSHMDQEQFNEEELERLLYKIGREGFFEKLLNEMGY